MTKKHPAVALHPETDEEILTALREHPGLLDLTKKRAEDQINATRKLWQFPGEWLTWKCGQISAQLRQANAPPRSDIMPGAPRADVDKQDVAHFRIYRDAATYFEGLQAKWSRAHLQEQREIDRALQAEMSNDITRRQMGAAMAHMATLAPVNFDAQHFVIDLGKRGISVTATAEDDIEVRPASLLDAMSRTHLMTHRDAILAAVRRDVAVF